MANAGIEIEVFSDYLCPWCWPAAVQLKRLKQEFGESVRIEHRAFLLRPGEEKREFSAYHLQHRVAAETHTGLPFHVPRVGDPYPRGSALALEAAKWVGAHHPDRFEDFHLGLFRAFFQLTMDISNPAFLAKLASQQGLDAAGLTASLERRELKAAVEADHAEAARRGIDSIPAVIVGDSSVSGAAPYEEYVATVREQLTPPPLKMARARKVAAR